VRKATTLSNFDFSAQRRELVANQALQGTDFARAYAELVDVWLASLIGGEPGIALVAVGGYGRAELCPGSDLDVLLLHRDRPDIAAVAQRLWYPIWDAGVGLDHSVRTTSEALSVARHDLKTIAGLLDARHIAGEKSLTAELGKRVLEQWRRHDRQWLAALHTMVTERHSRFGEVAFLVEPELKEGKGGLRDAAALHAVFKALPQLAEADVDFASLTNTLLAVRVELHRTAGKGLDQLVFEQQDAVASALGLPDADALLAMVSAAARTIGWSSDEVWRRVDHWLAPARRPVVPPDAPHYAGVALKDGEVQVSVPGSGDALSPSALPGAEDGDVRALLVGAAAFAAYACAPLSRSAIETLRTYALTTSADREWSEAARQALISLLGTGDAAVPVLETVDQFGLLVWLLPEWQAVRNRPQRNVYHRYTVDRHLLETAAQAAKLTRQVARPDLLLLAAWLHDLGKGYHGDHSEAGAELMSKIATRMGLPPSDVGQLATLMRLHLLLPDAATRRDLDDPATISAVADAVGDLTTLDLLEALTEADGKATGATAWTPWKESLVHDLVQRVRKALAGEHPAKREPLATPEQLELLERAAGQLLIQPSDGHVTIVSPDTTGLFCRIAGTLTLHGLDVLAATVWSSADGMAVDTFRVQSAFEKPVDWSRFGNDLKKVLAGRLSLEAHLADRATTYRRRRVSGRSLASETVLLVDNDASEAATVVEVRTADATGLLYRIARGFAELDLDIRYAKVVTLGHEAVDTFYVVAAGGAKVLDNDHIREVRRALLVELSRLER